MNQIRIKMREREREKTNNVKQHPEAFKCINVLTAGSHLSWGESKQSIHLPLKTHYQL